MAMELVAGTSQLGLMSMDAQCSEQLRTSIAGKLFQVAAQGGGTFVIGNISDRQARGDYAQPRIEGGKLTQKRLEGRLP